jgi:Phage integrase family
MIVQRAATLVNRALAVRPWKVELSPLAIEALLEHKRKALALGRTDGFVFRTVTGLPIRRGAFYQDEFKPLLKQAGLPKTRFHDLRHTAATLLLAAGEHRKIVQELFGRSNIAMTLGTYSHILPTMQRQAIDRLGAMLSTAAGQFINARGRLSRGVSAAARSKTPLAHRLIEIPLDRAAPWSVLWIASDTVIVSVTSPFGVLRENRGRSMRVASMFKSTAIPGGRLTLAALWLHFARPKCDGVK